ncbi:UNVERIFIED_CONTAM: hypothetical protein Slati_3155200 [Sesamum latifolium]|uniref:RNase H type-1 domain-containing protein n=1 Tax=Sesamum latifolium TaxID=2727402 RepID=A0AAW2UXD8_9LAMI
MQGNCLDPPHVPCFIAQFVNSFHSQNLGISIGVGTEIPLRWKVPWPDCIKVNFDGTTFPKGLELGARVVARDASGACVAWLSRRFNMLGDVEIAEAMAAREVIHLSLQRGRSSIIIKGDCATLIHKLQASEQDLSVVGPVIISIWELASCFCSRSFQFVKQSCNVVAHYLAQVARSSAEGGHDAPPAVASLVNADISRE